jgi:serine/threonine protein kinase
MLTHVQSNILVDAAGHARITDFGHSTTIIDSDSVQSAPEDWGSTTRWTAPEILDGQGTYSKEADVFSFAMVMVEVGMGCSH